MEKTTENLIWAAQMFRQVDFLVNFPQSPESMKFYCEEFLSVVESKERGEWLFAELARGAERYFPTLLEMRSVYYRVHNPADGIRPQDLVMQMREA